MHTFDIPAIAIASALGGFIAMPASAAPVKIGLVETLSGPQASSGQAYRSAVRYAIDQINAARRMERRTGCSCGNTTTRAAPAGAADKLKAAAADGVQIIVQGASSAIGGQITEDVRKYNLRNPGKEMVYINVGAEALELTGEKCNFYHFRFAEQCRGPHPIPDRGDEEGQRAGYQGLRHQPELLVGTGHGEGHPGRPEAGRLTVVEKTLHDVNRIQDFAPYVAKIAASGADTVITGNWSNDLLLLMKASKAAGLKARYGTVYLDQPGNLANAGELAVGNFVVHTFNAEAGGADAARFVDDYKAKTGHIPVFVEPQTVYGMNMVADALQRTPATNGVLNVNEFAKALETAHIATPMGEMRMRAADHQAQLPMVISTVTRDAKYKMDGTDMGFKPVLLLSARDASTPAPASCKMKRPS